MAGRTPHGAIDAAADSVFAGEHIPDEAPEVSPEQALWLRVIGQAWSDAFEASDWFLEVSDKPKARPADIIRAEARRWLTIEFGSDAEDREMVCDLAGIDPDMLRDAARRKVAQVKAEAAQETAEIIELDRAFARLLESEDTMAATSLDAVLAHLAALESTAAA